MSVLHVYLRAMKINRSQLTSARLYLTPRFLFGLALIITALFASLLISKGSQREIAIWRAERTLAPGTIIDQSAIAISSVVLHDDAGLYLSASAPILGSSVVRSIQAGELIPSSALSTDMDMTLKRVALSIPSATLPYALKSGEIVNIYSIPSQTNALRNEPSFQLRSSLVLSDIGIEGIEAGTRDIGGNSTITFLIPERFVETLLTAIIDHQIIIVKTR